MWTLLSEVPVGGTVKPDQRLPWLQTTGIGMQHVIAMFGATFLVPLLTGFPPTTTVFFSGVGTIIFLIVTRNKIPSYLGSSFAFIAPVIASMGLDKNIGLGYVPTALAEPGTRLGIEIRGKVIEAVVVKTPFYKRQK